MSRPALPSDAAFRRWGIDPVWSRFVDVAGADGVVHRWHVLDRSPAEPLTTIICVHGNPTWSLYWRSFVERFGDRYRVIAVDQLSMGFSERTPGVRPFAQRVDDLGDVIEALDVTGPVITAAHDWGGPISLGWVLRNTDRVIGVVLCNTGVAVPAGRHAPNLIRLAAAGPMTDLVCHRTRVFVDGTLALSHGRLSASAREGYRAPYRRAGEREAIRDFVADVPFDENYPSAAAVAEVAEGIRALRMPVLLAWGAKDPVFNDDFALDLAARMPHADRHRFPGVGHLVVEEADVAAVVDAWLGDRVHGAPAVHADAAPATATAVVVGLAAGAQPVPVGAAGRAVEPIWAGLAAHADDMSVGFVDGATGTSTTFSALHRRVMGIAAGLADLGVQPGDRIAVLVEPGIDLLSTVYACWRAGAVTVIADRGLGLRGLGAAVRGAHVQWVIGAPKAIAAARVLRWAPRARTIAVGSLDDLAARRTPMPPEPAPGDPAAVLYTSGATGPAKGVRYTHGQIASQRDALATLYGITAEDRLVAAFAPFALYGPALGIASTIPDVDVTAPGTLTAAALVAAVDSVDATIVFASPAALANVNRTAGRTVSAADPRLAKIRLVLSAGAPVPIATLRATARLCPDAELHTPYGMTECLPVADIELAVIESVTGDGSSSAGVCVGAPVDGARVLIAPLGFEASAAVQALGAGATGEILIQAPWLSDGYDQLWRTQHDARPRDRMGATWHRSGDVGHLDADGRLWVEGRSVHVVHAVDGPITPVPVEVAVERLDGIDRVAAVGVGPPGCQQLVVVVEDANGADGLAPEPLTVRVRDGVEHPVAAVLTVRALPVDIRHNTKIDRAAVAAWAADVLSGGRARRPW